MQATTRPQIRDRKPPADRPTCQCGATWTGLSRCHCGADGCHRTFSGLALFDRHRVDGRCVDPEAIMSVPKDGSEPRRVMFETDGIWQSVEEPADKGAALRLWREGRSA